jgi:hypothetical protein
MVGLRCNDAFIGLAALVCRCRLPIHFAKNDDHKIFSSISLDAIHGDGGAPVELNDIRCLALRVTSLLTEA